MLNLRHHTVIEQIPGETYDRGDSRRDGRLDISSVSQTSETIIQNSMQRTGRVERSSDGRDHPHVDVLSLSLSLSLFLSPCHFQ